MGFRIITGTGPVCSAVRSTYRERCKRSTNFAEHWWIEHWTHFVDRERLHRLFTHFGCEVNQIIDGHGLPGVGGRLGRKRLRRRIPFPRHVAFWYRPFFYWPDRLAGHPIEHVKKSFFCRPRDSLDGFSVHIYIGKKRSGGEIVIPNRMMHYLEVPLTLPCSQINANKALTKKIVPGSVTT